jgi:hypothetical protein
MRELDSSTSSGETGLWEWYGRDMARRLSMWLFAALLSACPSSAFERNIVDECSKAGVQCRLDGSKLGVCTMNTDGAFDCVSQH